MQGHAEGAAEADQYLRDQEVESLRHLAAEQTRQLYHTRSKLAQQAAGACGDLDCLGGMQLSSASRMNLRSADCCRWRGGQGAGGQP